MTRGEELAAAFMAKHRIGRKDLFLSRFSEHARRRGQLIREMRAAGLRFKEIEATIGITSSTIDYWMNEDLRKTQNAIRCGKVPSQIKYRVLAAALDALYA